MMKSKTKKLLSIGEVAHAAGVSIPTLANLVKCERIAPALVRQYPFYHRAAARRIEVIARQLSQPAKGIRA